MVVTAGDDEADNLYDEDGGVFAVMGENARMVAARVDRRRMRNIVVAYYLYESVI